MRPDVSPVDAGCYGAALRMWTVAAVVTLAWGVLSFGAVYPWAYWPLTIGAITVGLVGMRLSRGSKRSGASRGLPRMLAVLALATALQCVPLPSGVCRWLSPGGEVFFGVGSVLGVRQALSIDPQATFVTLAWLVALIVLFIGTARALRVVGVVSIARGIIGLGVLVALLGIIGSSTSSREVYGFWAPRYDAGPFGPFVNENHFAGWMIMVLPLSVGYLCGGVAAGTTGVSRDWRRRLLWLSTPAANELALVAMGATLMGVALVLTLSRSGITGCIVALLLLGWFAIRTQEAGMRRLSSIACIGLTALVAVGWVGVDAVAQEFSESEVTMAGRLSAWRDALHIVHDFPLTGTGMNTYGTATLLYETDARLRFVQAHNDYLQLAAEGGVLVGLPALMAAGLFLREVRRRFLAGEDDARTLWVRIGAVTGLGAIALQELVEFSLHMPGNAALFAVLCAIATHRATTFSPRNVVFAGASSPRV